MGETFFPDGLARTLSLIGRKKVAQECQTAPIERLGPLGHRGASPAWPASRDVSVQVAGGIDAEDEPLMEQQVPLLCTFVVNRQEQGSIFCGSGGVSQEFGCPCMSFHPPPPSFRT